MSTSVMMESGAVSTAKKRGRPRKVKEVDDRVATAQPSAASAAHVKSQPDGDEADAADTRSAKRAGKRKAAANIPVVRTSKKAKGRPFQRAREEREGEGEEGSVNRAPYGQDETEGGLHDGPSLLRHMAPPLTIRHHPADFTPTTTSLPASQVYWRKMTLPEPFVFNPTTPAPARVRGKQGRHQTPDEAEDTIIEPDKVTMADLCEDIRIGRTSSRGKDIERLRHEESARKKRLVSKALSALEAPPEVGSSSSSSAEKKAPAITESMEQRVERLAALKQNASSSAIQYRMVDGRLVIDETTLQVDRRARDGVQEPMDHVEDNPLAHRLNSASFARREKSERWSDEQTDNFYQALGMWGTDFELIAKMFMNRSRRQVKNKFIAEEKKDPIRIAIALKEIKAVDMDKYTEITGTEFRDVQEQQERLGQIKVDFDEKLRQEVERAKEKAKEQEAADAAKAATKASKAKA